MVSQRRREGPVTLPLSLQVEKTDGQPDLPCPLLDQLPASLTLHLHEVTEQRARD